MFLKKGIFLKLTYWTINDFLKREEEYYEN